jgi:hypothetical protein
MPAALSDGDTEEGERLKVPLTREFVDRHLHLEESLSSDPPNSGP